MKYFKPKEQIIHYSQLNNLHAPFAACFPTSLAMALRNNGFKWGDLNKPLDDYIYELAASPKYNAFAKSLGYIKEEGKNHLYWEVMCKIANDLMKDQALILTAKKEPFSMVRVQQQINAGRMMVAGTTFTGKGGHMVCISGYTDDSIVINDPYGNVNTGYKFNDLNRLDDGALVVIDTYLLSKIRWIITFN
jgi:hypothetical protein